MNSRNRSKVQEHYECVGFRNLDMGETFTTHELNGDDIMVIYNCKPKKPLKTTTEAK